MRHRLTLFVLTAAIAWSAVVTGQRSGHSTSDGQWPTYGGNADSSKYSRLAGIDRSNVKDLQLVWRWESPDNDIVSAQRGKLPATPAAFKATPILVDGVLYIKTSLSQAVAIDAATGKTRWVFDPETWQRE